MFSKIVMLATLQSSKYFFHSVQIVLSTSPGPLNFLTADELNVMRLDVFYILLRTVYLLKCDPHTRSLPQSADFLKHIKPCSYYLFSFVKSNAVYAF